MHWGWVVRFWQACHALSQFLYRRDGTGGDGGGGVGAYAVRALVGTCWCCCCYYFCPCGNANWSLGIPPGTPCWTSPLPRAGQLAGARCHDGRWDRNPAPWPIWCQDQSIYDHVYMYIYIRSYVIIYDQIWSCIILYDYIQSYMSIHDHIWSNLIIDDHIWHMIIYDHIWSNIWSCMLIYDCI